MINNLKDLVVSFDYVNYKGESKRRKVRVASIDYGSNEYYSEEQFFLRGLCFEKSSMRSFAINKITNMEIHWGAV